ncbi:MAG TPA: hypothetical protein VJ842_20020 [Pyrinomonadaceae bacterium]|nr:hypothetical protein [Pyrinomonadaceae bacterium]
MRRLTILIICALMLVSSTWAQDEGAQKYTNDRLEYTLDLPNAKWRALTRPDSAHNHTEFIYGDRSDGLLRIRKEVVDAGTTAADLSRRDHDLKLRFQPGYVEGKEEKFTGRINGVTSSYEYTGGGKAMLGRIYYLQADNRTIYVLHFTGARNILSLLRNQTDLMARSFHLK